MTTTSRVAILGLNDKGGIVGTDFQNNYLWRKNGRQIQLPGLLGVTALADSGRCDQQSVPV